MQFTYSGGYNLGVADNYDIRPYSMTVEDMDGDAKNELVVGVRQEGPLRTLGVCGEGRRRLQRLLFLRYQVEVPASAFGGSNYSTTTGDLDGDGKKEIYMFIWNKFTMRIFECTGDTSYTHARSPWTHGPPQRTWTMEPWMPSVSTDVNNDGVKEMYIASTEPGNEIFIVTGVTDVSNDDHREHQAPVHDPEDGRREIPLNVDR